MSTKTTKEEIEKAAVEAAQYAALIFREGRNHWNQNAHPGDEAVGRAVDALSAATEAYKVLHLQR